MQNYLIEYKFHSEFNFLINKMIVMNKMNKENKYNLMTYNYNYVQNIVFGDIYYGIVAKDYIN